ncbi:probable E3 ubiquitin-protein ligase TRIML1 isoform X3 [Mercenaria mercenaria]|uniref:probable E3 ubiquitin-protein ligase TRIML1 isoform X3 n=1 Tax=Mercenaria mercenaria TaxID=6596 RepID=UPI00234EF2FC|nr:probable E3 ubiquitin-protein ligase TRIML1 isoform X3 [Mercenaria mercenaria]
MTEHALGEQLECPVCLDRYETPKVLPCQHTFCLQCLGRVVENRNVVRCPECRVEHIVPATGISGFPTNITIQRLLAADALSNVPTPIRNGTVNDTGGTGHLGPMHRGDDLELQLALEISAREAEEERRRRANQRNVENDTRRRLENQGNESGCLVFTDALSNVPTAPISDGTVNDTGGTGHLDPMHRGDDLELQLALQISAREAEEERRRRANQRNVENDTRRRLENQGNESECLVFRAAKLSSDCYLERRAAVYLFVKACFAVFFWGALGLWKFKQMLGEALDNPFVEVYFVIESLFSLCWLFVGTAWIWGNFNNINRQCPEYVYTWNGNFINFALFLTVVDYIGLVMFLFYCGYTICEREGQSTVTNISI